MSISLLYGIPRQTLSEHAKRHCRANPVQDAVVSKERTAERVERMAKQLEEQYQVALQEGRKDATDILKVYRQVLAQLRVLEREDALTRAAEEAAKPSRPLDIPGVADLFNEALMLLDPEVYPGARHLLVDWLEKKRRVYYQD